MQILKEFKTFAVKGNAIDLAVGVIIGAAFGRVVTSLVEDIINPFIGFLTGNVDFNDKVIKLGLPVEGIEQIVVRYGAFITALINFLIVAFALFIVIRQINKLKKKEETSASPKKSEEVLLLTEIKDLLAERKS